MSKLNSITIRKANLKDASAILNFVAELDKQTDYLLYSKDERGNKIKNVHDYLEKIEKCGRSLFLIAENESKEVVGTINGDVSHIKKVSHVMGVGIGVLKNYQRRGIAKEFMRRLIDHALEVGVLRIEARIFKGNDESLNLFQKFGFVIEGTQRNAFRIEARLYDGLMVSLLLNQIA
jgi:RimJ/RimL family protein N-acetyltransferase